MPRKYRTRNFIASDNREKPTICLHPAIVEGAKEIAKLERKSMSWVIEDALSDYFRIKAALRKLKGTPKPVYGKHSNLKLVRKHA